MPGLQPRRPPAGLRPRRPGAAGLGTSLGTADPRHQGSHPRHQVRRLQPRRPHHRLQLRGPHGAALGRRRPANPGSRTADTPTRSEGWSSRPTARPSSRAATIARSRPGTPRPGSSGTSCEATPTRFTTWRFSPDGRTLASASWDKTCILWDLADQAAPRDTPGTYRPSSTPSPSARTAGPSRRRQTTRRCDCGTPPPARLGAS